MSSVNTNINKQKRTFRNPVMELDSKLPGRIPPQSKELEEAILGAIMLEKGAFDIAIEILKPECFYEDKHQKIFNAMKSLVEKNSPIDLLTVVEQLKFTNELEEIGGAYFVTKLTNSVVSTANLETHCRLVLQKFIQRELIRISGEIISDAYKDTMDVFDMLDEAESKLFEITNNHLKKNFDDIESVLVKTVKRIDEMRGRQDDITGVPTGFSALDKLTYGWQPTDLIILAARPSVGKTAFALNLARAAAMNTEKPTAVGFFSLEMSSAQLVSRILSAESEISLEKINRGKLEDHEMQQLYKKGIDKLSKAPIFIDDSAALNIFELRAKCRRLKSKHNVGIIIIDYLQLMSGSADRNSNREQEISKISRDLKGLAKELQVPIIALSQLSREVEKRKEGAKIPQLSDLRESGAIEQDADMVMFLFRPDYYEQFENKDGENIKGQTHIKIAKHRNGSLDTFKLKALLHIQKFVEDNEPVDFNPAIPGGGNFRKLETGNDQQAGFYTHGSKMNDTDFDDDAF